MRSNANWQQIGEVFQSSRTSTREIARVHGVTEGAIRQQAKKRKWIRPEPPEWDEYPAPVKPYTAPSAEAVEPTGAGDIAGSEAGELVKRGRSIILALMTELEVENANIHLLAELVELETADDGTTHRRRALQKALSLPVRTQAAKNLASALATLRDAVPGKKEQEAEQSRTAAEGSKWERLMQVSQPN